MLQKRGIGVGWPTCVDAAEAMIETIPRVWVNYCGLGAVGQSRTSCPSDWVYQALLVGRLHFWFLPSGRSAGRPMPGLSELLPRRQADSRWSSRRLLRLRSAVWPLRQVQARPFMQAHVRHPQEPQKSPGPCPCSCTGYLLPQLNRFRRHSSTAYGDDVRVSGMTPMDECIAKAKTVINDAASQSLEADHCPEVSGQHDPKKTEDGDPFSCFAATHSATLPAR
ncbi:hypothetical protein M0657_004156 [Pyricularia oryzae]|nr:hypothetical protein M0657_004156 [Pyricularia oryzae]KAI7926598.1 hypothetical protein M9X92_002612 [Pyricularia oryzae]